MSGKADLLADMNNSFDFFVGTWTSTQQRLRKVFADSHDWDEFTGITTCWNIFDGAGNIDEVRFPEKGTSGFTLRLYDKASDQWSLYWANSQHGLAMPPQVGRFDETGRGEFLADDVYEGQAIKVVYIWSGITDDSARWEQAFSADGGKSWETNWTAQFTRTS